MKSHKLLYSSLLLLLLGFVPFHIWPLSWAAFIPIFILLLDPKENFKNAAISGLSVGLVYSACQFLFLFRYNLDIFLFATLSVIPFYPLFFTSLAWLRSRNRHTHYFPLIAAACWVLCNRIYALTPITTGTFETPFDGPFEFFQIASIFGITAHGALIIGLNASVAEYWTHRRKSSLVHLVFFACLLVTSFVWGRMRLAEPLALPNKSIKVAIIQHHLPTPVEWKLSHWDEIMSTYHETALEAAKENPDLVIFPLYGLDGDPERRPDFFTNLSKEIQKPIMLATDVPRYPLDTTQNGFFTETLTYTPDGKVLDYYRALRPPPFHIGIRLSGDFPKTLMTSVGTAGVHLCYENTVASHTRLMTSLGAEFLVSLSNPGHFTDTYFPAIHLMFDRIRAIESGKYFLRGSPDGYSAIIDPYGRIISQTNLAQKTILVGSIGLKNDRSFFHSQPDWLAVVSILMLAAFILRKPRMQ